MNELQLLERLSGFGTDFMEKLIYADSWQDLPDSYLNVCIDYGLVNEVDSDLLSSAQWYRIEPFLRLCVALVNMEDYYTKV